MSLYQLRAALREISRPALLRQRDGSLARSWDTPSQTSVRWSARKRANSLVYFLKDLPHYPLRKESAMVEAQIEDPKGRTIPRRTPDNDLWDIEFWYEKPKDMKLKGKDSKVKKQEGVQTKD